MAQKFPYEKASMAIAEADVFGDKYVLEKYKVNKTTLWRWRDRANVDGKLHQSATLKKRILIADWQQDATRVLKSGLEKLNSLIQDIENSSPENIHALSGAIKIVGELKVTSEALLEPNGVISDRESTAA